MQVQFFHHAAPVGLHRVHAQVQRAGNLLVRLPVCDHRQNLSLPARQLVDRIRHMLPVIGQHRVRDRRTKKRLAARRISRTSTAQLCVLSRMTFVFDRSARICRVLSMPLNSGIDTSITTAFGCGFRSSKNSTPPFFLMSETALLLQKPIAPAASVSPTIAPSSSSPSMARAASAPFSPKPSNSSPMVSIPCGKLRSEHPPSSLRALPPHRPLPLPLRLPCSRRSRRTHGSLLHRPGRQLRHGADARLRSRQPLISAPYLSCG